MTMELEILSKETIKPNNPTPPSKRVLHFSLLDQFAPHLFNRVIFFYLPAYSNNVTTSLTTTELLKRSLSRTLTSYYPFAGRVSEQGYIDCNDEGVELYQCQSKGQISDILRQTDIEHMSKLLPLSGDEAINGSCTKSLLIIQITKFACGGMAIGACFSHKIADGHSVLTFMNDWALMNRDPNYEPCPKFDGAWYFPARDGISPKMMHVSGNCSTRRLVFDVSKIDALRHNDILGGLKDLNPTRFEIVTTLICKSISCAFATLGLVNPIMMNIIVNLRTRIAPPLAKHHIGNCALHNLVKVTCDETNLQGLVRLLKDSMTKFNENFVHDQHSQYQRSLQIYKFYEELEKSLGEMNTEIILFSNLLKFPFYHVDFGFGKPIWASVIPNPTNNCIFVNGTRGGDGIEAWVNLEDRIMDVFEHDKELLGFAFVDPSPLESDLPINQSTHVHKAQSCQGHKMRHISKL